MSRPFRASWLACLFCLVVVVVTVAAGSAAGAGSIADAARSCSPPHYPGSGYFTSLTVNGEGCATARKLAVAYYRCRVRSGRSGRCHRRVLGYKCKETRNTIPTEFNARVTCRLDGRTVIHTYQQNT